MPHVDVLAYRSVRLARSERLDVSGGAACSPSPGRARAGRVQPGKRSATGPRQAPPTRRNEPSPWHASPAWNATSYQW